EPHPCVDRRGVLCRSGGLRRSSGAGLRVKGDHVNTASALCTLAVLSMAGLAAFPLTARAAFSDDDAAAIQTALAGKTVAEGAVVPRGFVKVAQAKGDLTGDGADDLALIVRRAAKRSERRRPPMSRAMAC